MGGTDNLKTSIGHNWQQGPINSPTVLNSSMNLAQFWDGRAKDLKAQAGGPIANPGEMAFTHELAVDVLNSIPAYKAEFKSVFGKDGATIDMVTDAIAAFEETLNTPHSRFDKWLKGQKNALSKDEQEGYKLFKDSGCTACHYGPAVGGNSFQKMGLVAKYDTPNKAEGVGGLTGVDADRMKFKVPTLRNVELTYPYFHDGEADTLEKAVDIMGKLQVGRAYTPDEIAKIVAFLKTLTGKQPTFLMPILPPSTNDTPKPKPFG
jgi:cytochrome c peroxidase